MAGGNATRNKYENMLRRNMRCQNEKTYHNNFVDTINGKYIAEKIEIFPLPCFRILKAILKMIKKNK